MLYIGKYINGFSIHGEARHCIWISYFLHNISQIETDCHLIDTDCNFQEWGTVYISDEAETIGVCIFEDSIDDSN